LANRQPFFSWALLNDPPPQVVVKTSPGRAAGPECCGDPGTRGECPVSPHPRRPTNSCPVSDPPQPHLSIPELGFVVPVGGVAGSIACSPLRYTGEGGKSNNSCPTALDRIPVAFRLVSNAVSYYRTVSHPYDPPSPPTRPSVAVLCLGCARQRVLQAVASGPRPRPRAGGGGWRRGGRLELITCPADLSTFLRSVDVWSRRLLSRDEASPLMCFRWFLIVVRSNTHPV